MKLGEFVCRLALNAIYVVVAGLRVKHCEGIGFWS